jgi:hypothetical protein
MNMAEFNTFGKREKLLLIQAQREHGYISFGQSAGADYNGRPYRELYVYIKMWTPSILIVDRGNQALWDELYAKVQTYADQIRAYYAKAEDELIASFDKLVEGTDDESH